MNCINKLKKFILILLLSFCSLLYKETEIEILENDKYVKIVKITFWGV